MADEKTTTTMVPKFWIKRKDVLNFSQDNTTNYLKLLLHEPLESDFRVGNQMLEWCVNGVKNGEFLSDCRYKGGSNGGIESFYDAKYVPPYQAYQHNNANDCWTVLMVPCSPEEVIAIRESGEKQKSWRETFNVVLPEATQVPIFWIEIDDSDKRSKTSKYYKSIGRELIPSDIDKLTTSNFLQWCAGGNGDDEGLYDFHKNYWEVT